MVELGLFHEDHQHHAGKSEERSQSAYIQGDQKAGDRGADVGAHDDPDRLIERHDPGVNKSHHHDRGGGGGLDHSGDHSAHQNTEKSVGGQLFQDAFHPVTGGGLQTGTHHLHTVQEQGKASQETEEIT